MKTEKGITVAMRDGVKISLCLYRPEGPGPFPTLFAASPYQYEMDDVPAYPLFLWRETGPVEWYSEQGYAYVHVDVRGSGHSEGEFEFMGPDEQQDYLEVLAWIVRAALVQRPRRRHRPVVLRDGAMADGDLQPAGACLHRPLRRARRSVSRFQLSRRDFLFVPLGLVHVAARRQPASPGRRPEPAADEIRSGRRDHRTHARRRILARALAVLAARQDQVPGSFRRPLGQDGAASARQHRGLRGAEMRRRSSSSPARATPSKRTRCSTRSSSTRRSCCRSTTCI